MAQRGEASSRKAWPFALLAILSFVATLTAVIDGDYLRALFHACLTATFGLLAGRANERGGVLAALMWAFFGVSVLALVGLVVR